MFERETSQISLGLPAYVCVWLSLLLLTVRAECGSSPPLTSAEGNAVVRQDRLSPPE